MRETRSEVSRRRRQRRRLLGVSGVRRGSGLAHNAADTTRHAWCDSLPFFFSLPLPIYLSSVFFFFSTPPAWLNVASSCPARGHRVQKGERGGASNNNNNRLGVFFTIGGEVGRAKFGHPAHRVFTAAMGNFNAGGGRGGTNFFISAAGQNTWTDQNKLFYIYIF